MPRRLCLNRDGSLQVRDTDRMAIDGGSPPGVYIEVDLATTEYTSLNDRIFTLRDGLLIEDDEGTPNDLPSLRDEIVEMIELVDNIISAPPAAPIPPGHVRVTGLDGRSSIMTVAEARGLPQIMGLQAGERAALLAEAERMAATLARPLNRLSPAQRKRALKGSQADTLDAPPGPPWHERVMDED